MVKERTQLNINIDPDLLLRLKSEAIKSGKTLTTFVTEKLADLPSMPNPDGLEERLARIEKHLNLDKTPSFQEKGLGRIFTDEGAKTYGDVAKKLFELH